jgi:hypothetical protein
MIESDGPIYYYFQGYYWTIEEAAWAGYHSHETSGFQTRRRLTYSTVTIMRRLIGFPWATVGATVVH